MVCKRWVWSLLTWEIPPEAGLSSDHPLCSGFTEDGDGAFGLLPQRCQPAAKLVHYRLHLIVGQPCILPQDQLQ